ncbi:MOSC domain-containing protein [Colletotrichum tofieldiae]|nr:MOSC domain-containing protein [Colletotrichum tofieldiae]
MSTAQDVDLWSPFTKDILLEVRTGMMKMMPGLDVESGIDKNPRDGPVRVSFLGLDADAHDPTFHGGVDKAVHGYCSSHYLKWREEYPAVADRFKPGAFGENFVTKHMNERNVCIGDVISVGDEVLLQSSRTGWYYRVLKEGTVKAGDEIQLVKRKWPKWTIERVQEYLHRNQNDQSMNEELAEIEEMGKESRNTFQRRVAKAKAQKKPGKGNQWRDYKVTKKMIQTPRIVSIVLEAVNPRNGAADLQPGTHAKLKLPNGFLRFYSIVSGTRNRFELGVALDDNSRGGSRYIHESMVVGDVFQVGKLATDVKVASASSNHVFIVGGIGITAFIALAKACHDVHYSLEMHYAVRSADDVPFRSHLEALGRNVRLYDRSKGEKMDIDEIIRVLKWNSHVYACGPTRMIEATRKAAEQYGLDAGDVHYEAFSADTSGDPFEVEIMNRDGRVLRVGEEETLLEVLKREFGGDVESGCETGNCGTCKVALKTGLVHHRGTALTPEEKNGSMLCCVSRGIGRIAIEI